MLLALVILLAPLALYILAISAVEAFRVEAPVTAYEGRFSKFGKTAAQQYRLNRI